MVVAAESIKSLALGLDADLNSDTALPCNAESEVLQSEVHEIVLATVIAERIVAVAANSIKSLLLSFNADLNCRVGV